MFLSHSTHEARLACGYVIKYARSSFVPHEHESVPCVRHGYCVVVQAHPGRDEPETNSYRSAEHHELSHQSDKEIKLASWPSRRTALLNYLSQKEKTSLYAMNRHGFTLRWLIAAEREGLLHLDLDTGDVRTSASRITDTYEAP